MANGSFTERITQGFLGPKLAEGIGTLEELPGFLLGETIGPFLVLDQAWSSRMNLKKVLEMPLAAG